jgi:hypothetical protein
MRSNTSKDFFIPLAFTRDQEEILNLKNNQKKGNTNQMVKPAYGRQVVRW